MNNSCEHNFTIPITYEEFEAFKNCSQFASDFSSIPKNKEVERVFRILLYIIATIANSILLLVIYKDPLVRLRNATSYFLMNLAIADLLSVFGYIAHWILQLKPPDLQASVTLTNHDIALCIAAIGSQCSLLMIMVFSLDRYFAITHAYIYKKITSNKCAVAMVVIFPWCFAITIMPVIYFGPFNNDVHNMLTRVLAGNFIVLCVITLTVHPYTHCVFLKNIKALKKSSVSHKELLEENLKVSRVLANTVFLVSVCLIIHILPYFVAFCFHVTGCYQCLLNSSFQSFWRFYPILSSIRFVINSTIYAWRLPLYKKSLKTLLINCGFGNREVRPRTQIGQDSRSNETNRVTKESNNIESESSKNHEVNSQEKNYELSSFANGEIIS